MCPPTPPPPPFVSVEFNATGILKLHTRGCLDADLCDKTITGSILGAGFTSSFSCCSTDLCNGASVIHIPLLHLALSVALVAVMYSA